MLVPRSPLAVALIALATLPAQQRTSDHWSLRPPVKLIPPAVHNGSWPKTDLDRFVLAALELRGWQPAPAADPASLLRRVCLDLTGLPPSADDLAAFVADPSDAAYARVVDRLLASPHYGERWARPWLDLARYADTNGYEKDRKRSIWPWRDWVIAALNDDMPFDQFTIEQLAGDMLPGATPSQRIATGFHRNSMVNEEGGIDVEEFRYAAVVDRVATTATTWLGLTVGCAQCHDHKYDPISQRDFFGMLAIFDNCDELVTEVGDDAIEAERSRAAAELTERWAKLADQFPPPMPTTWTTWTPSSASSEHGATLSIRADGSVQARGKTPDRDTYTLAGEAPAGGLLGVRIEALVDADHPAQGPGRTPHGNFVLSELEVSVQDGDHERRLVLSAAAADAEQNGFAVGQAIDGNHGTGWAIPQPQAAAMNGAATVPRGSWPAEPIDVPAGARLRVVVRQLYGGTHTLGRLRISLHQGAGGDLAAAPRRTATRSSRRGSPRSRRRRNAGGQWFRASCAPRAMPTSTWASTAGCCCTATTPTATLPRW